MGELFAGFLIGVSLTVLVVAKVGLPSIESQIIERGYGLYCPDTGHFSFKGECGND